MLGERFTGVDTPYGRACIRHLTGKDLAELLEQESVPVDVLLVCYCLVDVDTKQPLFRRSEATTGTFDDMDAGFLRTMGAIIDRVVGLNAVLEASNAAEDLAKN